MKITLSAEQEAALSKMKNGCILHGGTGSGKSLTSLAYYIRNEGNRKLYIITVAKKRNDKEWDEDMMKIGLDPKKVVVDSWNNIRKYENVSDAFFIFDEQKASGDGPWANTFIKLSRKNRWILLSATPGDNWLDYIPVFIANGFFKSRSEFKRNHVKYMAWAPFPNAIEGFLNEQRLYRLRDKILVDMEYKSPAIRDEKFIVVDYDKAEYRKTMRERFNYEKNEPMLNAAELCQALRKICNTDPSRIEKVKEIVSEKKKAIIFYNFDYELEILKNMDWPMKTKVAEYNGHKHQPIPNGPKWVYLVNYNSGAEGWNCLKTDTIIFYSQNYSWRVIEQCRGRIDRRTTPYEVLYYYHIRCKAPIETSILNAYTNKKKFNERKFVGKYFTSR